MTRVRAVCAVVVTVALLAVGSAPANSVIPMKFSDDRLKDALLTYEEVVTATGSPGDQPQQQDFCYTNGCGRAWYGETGLPMFYMEIRQFPTAKQARNFFAAIQRNGNPSDRKYNSRSPARVIYTDPTRDQNGLDFVDSNGLLRRGRLIRLVQCSRPADAAAEALACATSVLSALDTKAKRVLGS